MKPHLSSSKTLVTLMVATGLAVPLSASATPVTPLPPAHSVGPVTYISGGVGQEEADSMKQAESQFRLKLTFLTREKDGHGAYNAGDEVIIRDQSDNIILDTQSEGPFLLTQLPPGKYEVEAIDNGQRQKRAVTVKPDKHAQLVFEW